MDSTTQNIEQGYEKTSNNHTSLPTIAISTMVPNTPITIERFSQNNFQAFNDSDRRLLPTPSGDEMGSL
ncbi:23783_t:CDS:1, partial [Dentiscutata erythropus]